MVEVFRGVWRVLRDDGTLWLNLGDSYASGEIGRHDALGAVSGNAGITYKGLGTAQNGKRQQRKLTTGLKPKDLCGVPWRVAFALQADGWYLRSDIIWHKPNPMPESVQDRPTKAHEYLFLLAKQERYFYDAAAIREPTQGLKAPTWAERKARGEAMRRGFSTNGIGPVGGGAMKNKRTVWTLAGTRHRSAHFATFPERLVEPCILAGCPVGGTVLDPFAGSGTALAVAARLGRQAIGIDLSPTYCALAAARLAGARPAPERVAS